MTKQTLYILTGLPYAGKTTLRNELVRRFGFASISIDEINDDKGRKVEAMAQSDWDTAYSNAYDQLKAFLGEGKSVVFDGGSLLFQERETQRLIAKDFGVPSVLVYVNTLQGTIMERRAVNSASKERGHVSDPVFEKAFGMWEEPTAAEHPIPYNQEMNFEEWIKNIPIRP